MSRSKTTGGEILCVGEIVWDVFPRDRYLGGAPFNVSYHLHALGQPVAVATRVGEDEPGREIRRRLTAAGIDGSLVQTDPSLPTGRVNVTLIDAATPSYEVVSPASWDQLELTDELAGAAASAAAIVFGSLAQRGERSRRTIGALLSGRALVVFDVNLRPPFVERSVIERSLAGADIVKLNDDELSCLGRWLSLPVGPANAVDELARRYSCQTVCVTRGARGAELWHRGQWFQHEGYRVPVTDPVGAGDAFLAALLTKLLAGEDAAEALDFAAAAGAFVVSRPGATPGLEEGAIQTLRAKRVPRNASLPTA